MKKIDKGIDLHVLESTSIYSGTKVPCLQQKIMKGFDEMAQSQSRTFLRVAMLSIIFVSQLNTIASVIIADLVRLFPDASPTAIQMVMQFGMIGAFPVTLSVGFFSQKFRIKPMICIGLIGILIGGLLPLLAHTALWQLYIGAVLVGAGQGFLSPLISKLTLSNFEDKSRARQIGLNSTFGTGGATIVTLLAGVLALRGWLNTFYIYFLALPALIIALLLMPMGDKPSIVEKTKKTKTTVPPRTFVQAAILIVMFVAYVTFPINIGMLIAAEGIGDSASTGLSISLITVVGAVFGLIFPYVIKALKTYIGVFTAAFGTLGLLVVATANSIGMIYFGAVLLGCYFGSGIAGVIYIIGRMCKPEQFGPSLSIVLGCIPLGVVLSPIIINNITPLWGGQGSVGAFTTSGIIMAIVFVFQIIWATYIKNKYPEAAKEAPAEAVAA